MTICFLLWYLAREQKFDFDVWLNIFLQTAEANFQDLVGPYHGDGEGVDALDIHDAVLPGDETLDVDIKLAPDWQDCFVVLLVSLHDTEVKFKGFRIIFPARARVIQSPLTVNVQIKAFFVSYLLARLMLIGLGGGTIRHTEGTNISRPPGPVTSHLLRWLLSFRIASLPLRITFCEPKGHIKHIKHKLEYKEERMSVQRKVKNKNTNMCLTLTSENWPGPAWSHTEPWQWCRWCSSLQGFWVSVSRSPWTCWPGV